jgi:hypothetical protein
MAVIARRKDPFVVDRTSMNVFRRYIEGASPW